MKNPTAVAALDLIRKHDGGPVCYDHFAFRTFGVSLVMLFDVWSFLVVLSSLVLFLFFVVVSRPLCYQ